MDSINITNQQDLDNFLNVYMDIEIKSDEPLVIETDKKLNFYIYGSSVVTFSKIPVGTFIYVYDDALATIESENDLRVYGYDNSIIVNRNENSNILECSLFYNAKFKDESLDQKALSELYVYDIYTQERLDECLNLYENYENVHLHIINNALEPGAELVVNKKINGKFYLGNKSRVVFKSPTNTDNDSIDYYIRALEKSTAILETNKCKVSAYDDATIIKRCKDDIAYKYITENAKLVDESHLLDANEHKETSKGRGK
jgi:hypothetical protein